MSEISVAQEKETIKKAILDYYHQGHVIPDPELYKQILHKDWKFFFFDKEGELKIADRDGYCSWYDPKKADKTLKWKTEFFNIDVTGYTAAAKISISNQKAIYIDYFNLLKIKGKWWIVHKISYPIRKK